MEKKTNKQKKTSTQQKSKSSTTLCIDLDVEKQELLNMDGGSTNGWNCFGEQFVRVSKSVHPATAHFY